LPTPHVGISFITWSARSGIVARSHAEPGRALQRQAKAAHSRALTPAIAAHRDARDIGVVDRRQDGATINRSRNAAPTSVAAPRGGGPGSRRAAQWSREVWRRASLPTGDLHQMRSARRVRMSRRAQDQRRLGDDAHGVARALQHFETNRASPDTCARSAVDRCWWCQWRWCAADNRRRQLLFRSTGASGSTNSFARSRAGGDSPR